MKFLGRYAGRASDGRNDTEEKRKADKIKRNISYYPYEPVPGYKGVYDGI